MIAPEAGTTAGGLGAAPAPAPNTVGLFERRGAKTIPHDIWDKLLLLALLLLPIDAAIRRLRIGRDDVRAGLSAAMRWICSYLPWPRTALETDGSGAAALGLAQLKTSRSRIRLRSALQQDEGQTSREVDSIERDSVPGRRVAPRQVRQQPEAPSTNEASPDQPGEHQPLPSRLLDAKRTRRD